MRRHSRWRSSIGPACLLVMALAATVGTPHAATPSKAQDEAAFVEPIDINKATAEGLTSIPGIGQAMADRIVTWRNEHGPFRHVEDLMKVKGIGEKSFKKLRPYVKVGKDG